jgi:hypothetical protein
MLRTDPFGRDRMLGRLGLLLILLTGRAVQGLHAPAMPTRVTARLALAGVTAIGRIVDWLYPVDEAACPGHRQVSSCVQSR